MSIKGIQNVSINKCIQTLIFISVITMFVACTQTQTQIQQPPPANEEIFVNPSVNTHFNANQGVVLLSQLREKTVCYTLDGSEPGIENDECTGENTQVYSDGISLACIDGEEGDYITREVKLVFEHMENGTLAKIHREALFFLECGEIAIEMKSMNPASQMNFSSPNPAPSMKSGLLKHKKGKVKDKGKGKGKNKDKDKGKDKGKPLNLQHCKFLSSLFCCRNRLRERS